jgi:hypothetical protein
VDLPGVCLSCIASVHQRMSNASSPFSGVTCFDGLVLSCVNGHAFLCVTSLRIRLNQHAGHNSSLDIVTEVRLDAKRQTVRCMLKTFPHNLVKANSKHPLLCWSPAQLFPRHGTSPRVGRRQNNVWPDRHCHACICLSMELLSILDPSPLMITFAGGDVRQVWQVSVYTDLVRI